MREVTRLIRRRKYLKNNLDTYGNMWFNYHCLFFGRLISSGKKIKAFNKFINLKYYLKQHESIDPYLVFLTALIRVTPSIYLRPLRLGGFTQGVPLPITEKKRVTFAIKWFIKVVKKKNKNISSKDLANLMILSIYDKGPVIALKKNTHQMGRMNRHLLRFYN
jgi:ribosomal protein S7